MYLVALGVALVIARLAGIGPVATWAWWLVLAPFGLALAWWAWADTSGYTKRRAMAAMEAKREARRRQHMEALGTTAKGRPPAPPRTGRQR